LEKKRGKRLTSKTGKMTGPNPHLQCVKSRKWVGGPGLKAGIWRRQEKRADKESGSNNKKERLGVKLREKNTRGGGREKSAGREVLN